jgi:hypothetical protein
LNGLDPLSLDEDHLSDPARSSQIDSSNRHGLVA